MKHIVKTILILVFSLGLVSCEEGKSKEVATVNAPTEEIKVNSHLYVQTNESENEVIHYSRNADGTLIEVERVRTNGKGTNGFKATTGETSAPDPLLSANSVILSRDHQMLFVANSGNNTVSIFKVGDKGKLTLKDTKASGENSSLNSLSYNASANVLYALHSFGPNHISMLKVGANMKLTPMSERYTINTPKDKDRIPTQIIMSPDDKFVLVDVLFNARPVGGESGPILTPSNATTGDGVVVFPIAGNGTLGSAVINDSGTPTPFSMNFLHGSHNTFINTFAAGNGAGLSKLNPDGKIVNLSTTTVSLDQAPKGPSETCWVVIDSNNKYAYAANFGLGTISSFEIGADGLRVKADKMAKIEGTTGFRALAGIPTSGPADNWMSSDDFFYQIYGAAGILVAFKAKNGELTEVGRYPIPVHSTQGIAGF
jgi:6-phosphogluconolactonase (cycloisomerase 2 family)